MTKLSQLLIAATLSSLSLGAYAHNSSAHDFFKNHRATPYSTDASQPQYCKHNQQQKIHRAERHARMQKRVDFKVAKMASKLGLNKQQQQQYRNIIEERMQQQRHLKRQYRSQLRNLLTPQQRAILRTHYRNS